MTTAAGARAIESGRRATGVHATGVHAAGIRTTVDRAAGRGEGEGIPGRAEAVVHRRFRVVRAAAVAAMAVVAVVAVAIPAAAAAITERTTRDH